MVKGLSQQSTIVKIKQIKLSGLTYSHSETYRPTVIPWFNPVFVEWNMDWSDSVSFTLNETWLPKISWPEIPFESNSGEVTNSCCTYSFQIRSCLARPFSANRSSTESGPSSKGHTASLCLRLPLSKKLRSAKAVWLYTKRKKRLAQTNMFLIKSGCSGTVLDFNHGKLYHYHVFLLVQCLCTFCGSVAMS